MSAPLTVGHVTADMARELALDAGVCIRPQLRSVLDRQSGETSQVALACGSTREAVCPPCAARARALRMQQCAEGWHREDEPEVGESTGDDMPEDTTSDTAGINEPRRTRRTRSTRRHDPMPLPKVPMDDRTVGVVFTAPDGTEHRPSMFVTLTLPSYGPVADGVPVSPRSYNYRRAALDAMLFSRLVDLFWKTLRRCAGFEVQYFSAVEEQRRLAPHLHAAIRGAIPRQVLRDVVRAVCLRVWWPPFDQVVYGEEPPIWVAGDYVDRQSGAVLPTWEEALDAVDSDPDAQPAHMMQFGPQVDIQGIVRDQPEADRAIRYLVKYLTKDLASTYVDDATDPAYERHIDRLHRELRFLPCSEGCANWLRYGIQPKNASPGLVPGRCAKKAHERENLGIGGRRVLVSRKWTSKTLKQHRADRAAVVREALDTAGITAPEIERMSAEVEADDGLPRFVWTVPEHDHGRYAAVVVNAVAERVRWRAEYAKARAVTGPVDSGSTKPP